VDIAQSMINAASNKKQKHYVLIMFNLRKAESVKELQILERMLHNNFPEFGILKLEDPEEGLKVLLLKQVDIIILEWSFLNDNSLAVEYARECKQRIKCPILFLTRDEPNLILNYQKKMLLYEELDDYISVPVEPPEFTRKLKKMIQTEGRAAKRFRIDVVLSVLRLKDELTMTAKLVDMSLVGFSMNLESSENISNLAQIRVTFPLKPFALFHPQYGEVIKFSAKVRRVSIDGRRLGCSFEHLTSLQSDCLTRMLEFLAKKPKSPQFQTYGKIAGVQK
jgi:response regulator RpfG family c-di-GMP phosphodiesterase